MDRVVCMEAFVRVADAGSFAEAARRWGRSKAVVSKYVGQLEAHLGVRLLRRTTRSVSLTDAGRSHYERSQQVLTLLEESEAQLRAEHVALRGPLRVTAAPGFASIYGQPVFAGFLARFPHVVLDIDITTRMVDLVDERIDVALRLTKPADSSLVARRLAPAPLVVVASPAWLVENGAPSRPSDLARLPCLCDTNFRFHPRWPFRVDGKPVRVEVSGPAQANSPVVVRELVRAGLGIGLIPRMVVRDDLEQGVLVELLAGQVDVDWSVYAVTSQRRHLSARARAFIDHVREVLG